MNLYQKLSYIYDTVYDVSDFIYKLELATPRSFYGEGMFHMERNERTFTFYERCETGYLYEHFKVYMNGKYSGNEKNMIKIIEDEYKIVSRKNKISKFLE